MQSKRMWNGLQLPKGVFERNPGSGVLWIRYGIGRGRLRREVAGKLVAGVHTPVAVLRDAIALLERRRTEVRQRKHFPERVATRAVTFSELADDALKYSRRHKLRSYENDEQRIKLLREVFRGRLADEITPHDIREKLEAEEEKRHWAPATFNNYRLLLSMTYRVAIEASKVKSNPALEVKLRRLNNTRERWLSEDEEKRLRAVMFSRFPDHLPEFNLLYYTGLRLSDVYGRHGKHYQSAGLDWSHVNMDLHIATIPVDKNGRVKHIPLSPQAEEALMILGKRSNFRGRVVVDRDGSPIRTMGKWFWQALADAKIKNFRRHDLRHNLGSLLVQNGVPLEKIKRVLGHKDLRSTARYAHLSNADGVEAASVLGKIRPGTDTKTDTAAEGRIHLVEKKSIA